MGDLVDFTPLPGRRRAGGKPPGTTGWEPVTPVPGNAPAPPTVGPKGESPTAIWTYLDAGRTVLGYVWRFDRSDGAKDFRPLTWCQNRDHPDEKAWRWQSWKPGRPLYGLDRVAARPSAPVIVVEGEKAADAGARLAPEAVFVTSPGGAKAAAKADWLPLRGRMVWIWPDADEPGAAYGRYVAKVLRAMGCAPRLIVPPADVAPGWDAADAEAEGWTQSMVAGVVEAAREPETRSDAAGSGADPENATRRGRGSRREEALSAALLDIELWHDGDRRAFASVPIKGHFENMAVASRDFRIWLSGRVFRETGAGISREAIEDACRMLEARAIHEGPKYETWRRVAAAEEKIYLDLCDDDWRAVEIDAFGRRTIARPPVKFLRSAAARALPPPEISEDSPRQVLAPFFNVSNDADFMLACSWMVAALRPQGPYTILAVSGEQGSGKSGFCRMVRTIVDPNVSPIRAAPENIRDLVVTADNSWCICYDNLSGIPLWLSDALCRLSTGSGFSTRELHTDRDEAVFDASRPSILNGIPDLASRPDLADRTIGLVLPTIPETERRTEAEMRSAFDAALPFILGALLDGVSASIRNLPGVKLEKLPRMADFARIAVAAAPGLGWTGEEFLQAYEGSRAASTSIALEASPLAGVLQGTDVAAALRKGPDGIPCGEAWEGTATDLLAALTPLATDAVRKSKAWPRDAAALGSQLRRLAPGLRMLGYEIDFHQVGHAKTRMIRLKLAKQP